MGYPVLANPLDHQDVIRAPGHAEARAVGLLLVAGAALVVLSLVLPHPSGGDTTALIAIAVAMSAVGAACFLLARLVPPAGVHAILAATAVATGALFLASGVAAGQFGSIFVWATLIAAYFFSREVAIAHLAWLLLVYALVLTQVDSTAGYSVVTRWLFTAISLTVVMLLINAIVGRRTRADLRARRFFDLSHDLLCTASVEGFLVELNSAWEYTLGYSVEELRSRPYIELVHPDDRERTEAIGARIFAGEEAVGFENRFRARDGSWHWVRWSSSLSPDESLIYARGTDVTELKRIEAERENLLEEVRWLANSDALTGLPNRRTLDAQLPREMARSRRSSSSLCLALIDIDHFKAYNDAHGHLAGDQVLQQSAIAWDSELRGEDTIVRFGGEEFLVLLPDCPLAEGAEVVERLRAAMPDGQSCSAGLACWDGREPAEDLIGRADYALYKAKEGGRDRLVEAPPFE
jgi:diguanylate cyclase (GGDEF)-like protein/PAS domain S-box-containing protein